MHLAETQESWDGWCQVFGGTFFVFRNFVEKLESKGTGSKHLTHTCYLLPRQLFFFNLSYMVAFWRHYPD